MAPLFPTIPARPIQGGRLELALPNRGLWYAEPKLNRWRALIHTPTGTMWNRHGTPLTIADCSRPALGELAKLTSRGLVWADCEALERRHNLGRGTLVLLNAIHECGVPNYIERGAKLESLLPCDPVFAGEICSANRPGCDFFEDEVMCRCVPRPRNSAAGQSIASSNSRDALEPSRGYRSSGCRLSWHALTVKEFGMKNKETVSAGGLVLREFNGAKELLVVKRTRNVEAKWAPVLCQLPKGKVDDGESLQTTAIREVQEEAGYICEVLRTAGVACWSYERSGIRWHETVHYFLMRLSSNVTTAIDGEFDEVVWVSLLEAPQMISYPEEKQIIDDLIDYCNTTLN